MATSLTELLTQTRDYLDEATADRFTQAELRRYVNQGMRQVQSQIQRANEDYFLRVEVATASAGSYELAFPADIWGNKLRGLWYYENTTAASGTGYRVEPDSLENVYANMHVSGSPSCYTYHAGFLRWAPMLQYNSAFRFVYAMKETEFATDGSDDSNNLGQIADEHTDCIAIYAAILARMKIAAPTQELYALYSQRMNQIMDDVQPTDPFRLPQQVID